MHLSQPQYHQSDSPFAVSSDDADGETLAARYQMLEELGSGSFGVVYKAIEKGTGEIVAVKHVSHLLHLQIHYGVTINVCRWTLSPLRKICLISYLSSQFSRPVRARM